MNERIKQLAEQAGSTHKQNLGVYQFYTDELGKFAYLIIQDVLLSLEPNPYEKEIEHRVDQAFYNKCERIIKKHFEIEE